MNNKNLKPFKLFALKNFPFIEADFDAITNYELLCKIVEYLNKVIASQNETMENVQNLSNAFNQLYDYVHDYFDNLDVQEEINNKLDEMVEQGTLQEIIADYLNSKAIFGYDNVEAMKESTNLIEGSYAKTLGYYSVNDGGSATYKIRRITNDDVVDEAFIIAVYDDSLIAELIYDSEVNIKQLGAKGDNLTDDTSIFTLAINKVNNIIIPEGNYLVSRFLPKANQTFTGIGSVVLKTSGNAPQVELNSNSKYENIEFNSLSENLEWNRCNISNKENIIIKGCKFKNFRNTQELPNAWGLLLGHAHNISISDSYFENNTTNDIALVMDCINVTIDHCSGSNFDINIEPDNYNEPNKSISIKNSNIKNILIQENNFNGTATESLIIENCIIDELGYDGATTTLINCLVKKYKNLPASNTVYGGKLNIINSGNFTKNLFDDPYLDNFTNNTARTYGWRTNYTVQSVSNSYNSVYDNDGILFVINPNNMNIAVSIRNDDITVSEGDTFLLKVTGKMEYPASGTNYNSRISRVDFYNNDTKESELYISMFRSVVNSTSDFGDQEAIIVVPAGVNKMRVMLGNSWAATSTSKAYFRSIELFKINNNYTYPNNIIDLPVRENRVYKSAATPTVYSNYYRVGDKFEYFEPTTYIGAICTGAGYGTSSTWKNYGSLEQ